MVDENRVRQPVSAIMLTVANREGSPLFRLRVEPPELVIPVVRKPDNSRIVNWDLDWSDQCEGRRIFSDAGSVRVQTRKLLCSCFSKPNRPIGSNCNPLHCGVWRRNRINSWFPLGVQRIV